MDNDNTFLELENIFLELCPEEAIVLYEFTKRQLSKKRFTIGDNAEKEALLSLFCSLESHLIGYDYGLTTKSWEYKVKEAKEMMVDHEKGQQLAAERAKKIHEEHSK